MAHLAPRWEKPITRLTPTIARWVSTPENYPARMAVDRVADQVCCGRPQRENNPIFLHGPSGTGKTHLVESLAREAAARRPDLTIRIMAARELTGQDLISSTGRKYEPLHECDLLVVEDVQKLPPRANEVMVATLDNRLARHRQTAVTANKGPAQLIGMTNRLTSRLASGLVVGLAPLGRASRLSFLQDRIERRQVAVGRDVLTWLAENLPGSVRRLEGAVARLEVLTRHHGRFPDLETVVDQFRLEIEAERPTVQLIAERVGRHFQVDPRLLQSRRRSRGTLVPRQLAMALTRRLTPLSLEQIGTYFGGRDHSTVLHACRKLESGRDAALVSVMRQLQAEFA
jgi:chromosomal replication initiator protein